MDGDRSPQSAEPLPKSEAPVDRGTFLKDRTHAEGETRSRLPVLSYRFQPRAACLETGGVRLNRPKLGGRWGGL